MIGPRLSECLSLLTFEPFDPTTPAGRQSERYRLALWGALVSGLSTGVSMLTLLLSVSLTLPYLGEERFGVWMTISSFSVMLSVLDLGVGNGLINRVAQAKASDRPEELSFVITHGLCVLAAIALLMGPLALAFLDCLPWESLIRVKHVAREEIREALRVLIVILAASIPLNTIPKIFQGMQLAWQAHLVKALGSALSLAFVYLAANEQAGIPALLASSYGVQTVFPLVLFAWLVKRGHWRLGTLAHANLAAHTRSLLGAGWLFFALQIGGIAGWGLDSLIIAATLGAASVTQYALVQRLYQFVVVPLAIVNAPLWAAYADAQARGDRAFTNKTLKRSVTLTTLFAVVGVVLVSSASSSILELWINQPGMVPSALAWTYGLLSILMAAGNSLGMFLNGVGEIKAQLVTVAIFCVISLPAKFMAISHFGVVGLVGATTAAYSLGGILPYLTWYRSTIRKHLA